MSPKTSINRTLCNACAAGTLLMFSGLACAADSVLERKPLAWHLDGGYVLTDDSTSNFLEDGWMIEGGVTWRPQSGPIALRADLRYLGFDVDEDVVSLGGSPAGTTRVDDGDAAIVGLNLGASYNFQFGNAGTGYLTAGLGPYHRDVELTQTQLVPGIACEPFFGICFNALAASDVVIADSETTRLGWSAALGVEYPFRQGAVFLEARYLRIETEQPIELVPIQLGFRF
jgi:hypothetical protein